MLRRKFAYHLAVLTAISFCIIANTAEKQPQWVNQLDYIDDTIRTIGYSSEGALPEVSLRLAETRALSEMANVLTAVVKSSITTTMKADATLKEGSIKSIYESVTEMYSEATDIPGITVVDHYIDKKTGMTYALAQLKRADAVRDAILKTKKAIQGNESLFYTKRLDAKIKSKLNPKKPEFITATGYASVFSDDPEKPGDVAGYELAMRRAELDAREKLARQVRISISNSVKQWLKSSKDTFTGENSAQLFYEDTVKTFSEIKLQGSMIIKRYFSKDTNMAYAQAVMDKNWIAEEFLSALNPVIDKNVSEEKSPDISQQLDGLIHYGLKLLLEDEDGQEAKDQDQQETSHTGNISDDHGAYFAGWEWWSNSQQQGMYNGCLYGIGNGQSREQAENEALNSLARYTSVTIRSSVEAVFQSTGKKVNSSYFEEIDVKTNSTFYGVIHINHFDDSDNKWYSIAHIPPAPADVSICIYESINGEPDKSGYIRNLLEDSFIKKSYTVKYLAPLEDENFGGIRIQDVDKEVYMPHLSNIMIIGKVDTSIRKPDVDGEYSGYTKNWKVAKTQLDIDVIDTKSMNIIKSLQSSGKGIHRQDLLAIRMALDDSYNQISSKLMDSLESR